MKTFILKLLQKMFRCCPHCGSPFVTWNWIYLSKDRHNQLNPDNQIDTDFWSHECLGEIEWNVNLWPEKDCGCFNTSHKVKNGMPYLLVRLFYVWWWDGLNFIEKIQLNLKTLRGIF